MKQRANHTIHPLNTLTEKDNLFMSLQNRKFSSRQHTRRNKAKAELFIFILALNNATNNLFEWLDKPYQNQHVADIKHRMECRQIECYFNMLVHIGNHKIDEVFIKIDKWMEYTQYPY